MHALALNLEIPAAENITVSDEALTVELSDGQTITAPTVWFPRLYHSTPEERSAWQLIGKSHGIHWDARDEDTSIEGLIAGIPSKESPQSIEKWPQLRGKSRNAKQ